MNYPTAACTVKLWLNYCKENREGAMRPETPHLGSFPLSGFFGECFPTLLMTINDLEKLNQKRLQKHCAPKNMYFHPHAQIFSEGLWRRPALNCGFLQGEDSSFVPFSYLSLVFITNPK